MGRLKKFVGNKKIINAQKIEAEGLTFDSKLEYTIYKTLQEEGFTPIREGKTFSFVPRLRPSIPFFNRIGKVFGIDMRPLKPITYTPDFVFNYNDMLIIIEVKGYENDVFSIKRNLFRRYLEELPEYSMYFEVKSKAEVLQAIKIIKMETKNIQIIRKLVPNLPEKDIPIGNKLLDKRDFEELHNLVASSIVRVKKANKNKSEKYADIDIDNLYKLLSIIDGVQETL